MQDLGFREKRIADLADRYKFKSAHDKEVYDISFSPERNVFATVGADG
jgi:hypothetical protein